jgi:hypothetical protein
MTHSKKQQALIEELASICEELGWVVALPSEGEIIPGLVIGQEQFVIDVVSVYYGEGFDVYKKEMNAQGMEEMVPTLTPKKTGILH